MGPLRVFQVSVGLPLRRILVLVESPRQGSRVYRLTDTGRGSARVNRKPATPESCQRCQDGSSTLPGRRWIKNFGAAEQGAV